MLGKSLRGKASQAMAGIGSPMTGGLRTGWPAIKRILIIATVTIGLVVLVSAMERKTRGTGPLFIAATGFLVAFLDFHRRNRRVFAATMSVLPVMALWAWSARGWAPTKGATVEATTLGNEASMAGAGQVPALAAGLGMWLVGLPLTVKVVGLSIIGIVLVTRRNAAGGAS